MTKKHLFNTFNLSIAAILLIALFLACQEVNPSSSSDKKSSISYIQTVQPILASKCYACHGPDEYKREAGLRLDKHSSYFEKLESGNSVIDVEEWSNSELVKRINSDDPDFMMPPPDFSKSLEPEEIKVLSQWVKEGVSWEEHWAFKPLKEVNPPKIKNKSWSQNPIDRFIYNRLVQNGLSPSPQADRRTLIRRLSFDLNGLPPNYDEVEAFVNSKSPQAYEELVDKFLNSPKYGERWARHWLDIVHYGETHGYDKDKRRPNAWPYRDYVINALNRDVPYDRFIEDQIAGDELYPEDPQSLVSLGFLSAGPWDFVGHIEVKNGTVDKRIVRNLDRDDMVTSVLNTFCSLTIQCSRCHDHKFDPILQEDYYSLQAVFSGIDRANRPYDIDPDTHKLRTTLLKKKKIVERAIAESNDILSDESVYEIKKWKNSLGSDKNQLKRKLAIISDSILLLPKPMMVYAAATDFPTNYQFVPPKFPRPVFLLNRGDTEQPKHEVVPGTVSIIEELPNRFDIHDKQDEGARRVKLARWLTDEKNYFTWRSIVNRVWQYHFGQGIVSTPNDFGKMGTPPSHPDLLDYLSMEFLKNGRSLKWLHKLIVTSKTYQQASIYSKKSAKIDQNNRFNWRANRRQLDAESIRDGVLMISGKLNLKMGGPGYDVFRFEDDHSPRYFYNEHSPDDSMTFRRSIYRFIVRSVPDPFMSTLDCADPSQSVAVRNETVTALQALATLNNPFMVRQADYFAQRLKKEVSELENQIILAYRIAFQRDPTKEEVVEMKTYADSHGLATTCRLLFSLNEFLYID